MQKEGEQVNSLIKLKSLSIDFKTKDGLLNAVNHIDLEIGTREIVCLVGESGSGKTITSLAMMRLIDYENGIISDGEILFDGQNLASLSQKEINDLRGKKIAMVFQDPMNALDPVFPIGHQIVDVILKHNQGNKSHAWEDAIELLKKVGIPEPEIRMKQYPYELSGGMLQRVMIAVALACGPELLIADEPTTALDVTIQAQILELLCELRDTMNMSILLITHDLGVAAEMADRIVVMYAGKIVEEGDVFQIFQQPKHPYTQGLLRSIKSYENGNGHLYTIKGSIPTLTALPNGCRFHPRCPYATEQCREKEPTLSVVDNRKVACWNTEDIPVLKSEWSSDFSNTDKNNKEPNKSSSILIEVDQIKKYFPINKNVFQKQKENIHAVDNISFSIFEGETFGLVGESGCGKSTLGRLLLQLEKPTNGKVRFEGQDLLSLDKKRLKDVRSQMQVVFQDPAGSTNPRWKVEEIIGEPLRVHHGLKREKRLNRVKEVMELVGLNPEWYSRYPHEFSGGQRQRISIARAIALNPKFILLDEAVSALDVSVQSQVINLFKDLQIKLGLTYLFIAHGLNVVRHISDRIGVMYLGKLVEIAPAEELFSKPVHHYTRALLDANPIADPNKKRKHKPLVGELPSPANPPSGCRFHTRCPAATEKCKHVEPVYREINSQRGVACHYPLS